MRMERIDLVSRAHFALDSLTFNAAPLGGSLMHTFSEEAIEVSHFFVTQDRCNHADLRWWKDAEKPLRKRQANVDLKLKRRFVVLGNEVSFQRPHFHPDLTSDGANADLYIAVIGQYEMVHKACRIIEQNPMKIIAWRCSQRAELSDHFSLYGRQPFGGTTSHEEILKAKRRLRCTKECTLHSQRPAKENGSALAIDTLCRIHYRPAHQGMGRFPRSRGSTRVGPLHFRRLPFGNKTCVSAESTTERCRGWFGNSGWEQVDLSWALFLFQPRRRKTHHRISLSATRADIKQDLLDLKRRLRRRGRVNRF
jgi:hypothetical protein